LLSLDSHAAGAFAAELVGYSDPAMKEALYETTILRQFAGFDLDRILDETALNQTASLTER